MKRRIVIGMGVVAATMIVVAAAIEDGFLAWRIAGSTAAVACIALAATLPRAWLGATPVRLILAVATAGALSIGALDLAATLGEVFAFGLLAATAGFFVSATWVFRSLRLEGPESLATRAIVGVLLSLATLTTLLAVVERVAVALAPLALYDFVPDDRSFGDAYTLGPDDEMIGRPGFRGTMRHPEFFGIRVDFNDWGLRDGLDETAPIAAETDSILVLGDSFAFGTGVELRDTFHERLEERAADITSSSLRVTCAAMPGNAQTRELLTLDRWAERTLPDVVVVAFYFGNDFSDNIGTAFREAKASGALDTILPPKPARPTGPALPRLLVGASRAPFWLGGSAVCAQLLPTFEDRLVELGVIERARIPSNRFLDLCLDTRPSLERDYLRDFTLQQFDRLRTRCDELGAELVVLSVPSVVQASTRVFEAWSGHQPADRRPFVDRRSFHDAFLAALSSKGLRVVDTLPAIEAAELSGTRCYHREGHWNAEGHGIAANALVPILREVLASRVH